MKAVIIEKTAFEPTYHNAKLTDIPKPELTEEGQALLDIHAVSFNHRELWIRKGQYPVSIRDRTSLLPPFFPLTTTIFLCPRSDLCCEAQNDPAKTHTFNVVVAAFLLFRASCSARSWALMVLAESQRSRATHPSTRSVTALLSCPRPAGPRTLGDLRRPTTSLVADMLKVRDTYSFPGTVRNKTRRVQHKN